MRSPLNYLGGKSRLADRIVKLIPDDHVCYCEAFCGAAWVLFTKAESKVEVINDMDRELVTFWRVVQNHLEEFLRFYRHAVISREIFEIEKKKDPTTLTDIQRAARYYYLQRLAFGGKTVDRTFGTSALGTPRLNIANIEETLLEVHWRLKKVTIENLPALECIRRYDRPSTFFYLDPPYWETAGYAVPFGPADYDALARTLSGIQGRFLLSLNDVPDVRRIFGRFQIRTVKTGYTVANGRGGGDRAAERTEVLITGPARRRSTVAVSAGGRKARASKSPTLGSESPS